jgi:hypothetical protein
MTPRMGLKATILIAGRIHAAGVAIRTTVDEGGRCPQQDRLNLPFMGGRPDAGRLPSRAALSLSARTETSRAKLYMNIHHLVVAGNRARADDLRRFIPATEATVVTLDLLGEALRNRIIALRSGILLAQTPTPRWAESWRSLSPIGTRRTGP